MEDGGRSTFGTLLRHFRLAANLSQEALAERARISVETIGALERGARRSPYRDTLALLVAALGLGAGDQMRLEAAAARPQRLGQNAVLTPSTQGALALRAVRDPGDEPEPLHNLPAELSTLIGRDETVREIGAFVSAHRLVTLVGIGGIGKTRLALRVAENVGAAWRDGVWLVELADLVRPARVAEAVARVLGMEWTPQDALLDTVVEGLRRKHVLLVLDGCEQAIDEVAGVSVAILRGCPDVWILATGRQSMNVGGERTYRVPALASPGEGRVSAAAAAEYPAVMLFVERAQAAGDGFALSDDNATAVAEICRRLGGIPLAIESAATRVRSVAPRQLVKLLDERSNLLTGEARESGFTLLSEPERVLARRLAVFGESWTLEDAEAVCSGPPLEVRQILELLAALVGKSLVLADLSAGEGRYRYLESTRASGLEQLAASGERDAVQRRYAEWVNERT
jgi:predicted ATPase/transcriptional regulator with XRE-family HTH domain